MKKLYTLFLLCILLTACGIRIGYLGNRFPPTQKVDVFVEPSAIKNRYTVIGKGYEEQRVGYGIETAEKLQRKLVAKAKEIGADAVLVQDYFLPQNGTSVHTTTRVDTLRGAVLSTSDTYAAPAVQTGRQILFLKYE